MCFYFVYKQCVVRFTYFLLSIFVLFCFSQEKIKRNFYSKPNKNNTSEEMVSVLICVSTIMLTSLVILQNAMSAANSQITGPNVIQNFHGFASAQNIVNRLSQMTKTLEQLDAKLRSGVGGTSSCKAGN